MPEQKTKSPQADKTYVSSGKPFEEDERGKRKLDPSVKRQISKAKGELPDSVGVPSVHGSDEDGAFKKADALIQRLKESKNTEQYF